MSDTNNLYPNSKQEDMEQIQQVQYNFSGGMQSDRKVENVDPNAVTDLNNMRGTSQGLRGRHGSALISDIDLPTVLDGLTDLSRDGNIITASGTTVFTQDMFDYKIKISDTQFYVIKLINSETEVQVIGTDVSVGTESFTLASIRGVLNASFYNAEDYREYYLIGKSIYTRVASGEFSTPYFIHSVIKPTSSFSSFFKIGNYICLNNSNGIFVLNSPEDSLYAWRANSYLPQYKLDKMDELGPDFIDVSAYRAAYTFTRMKGNYTLNRLNQGSFIENETPPRSSTARDEDNINFTPPYVSDTANKDVTSLFYSSPISDTFGVKLRIDDASFASAKNWALQYESTENLYMKISYQGIWHICYFSFQGVETMTDVAESMQSALSTVVGKTINVSTTKVEGLSTIEFIFYANDPEAVIEFATTIDEFGYDLISRAGNQRAVLLVSTKLYLGKNVQWFRYPTDRRDVTHYSYYRSINVYEVIRDNPDLSRYVNLNPNLLGWVDDIPVCKIITMSVSDTVATTSDVSFSDHDLGCIFTTLDGRSFTLTKQENSDEYITTGFTGVPLVDAIVWLGADVCSQWIQIGNEVERVGYEGVPSETEAGLIIFWQNGTTSTITGISANGLKYTVLDYNTQTSYGLLYPTYRAYNDNTSDSIVTGTSEFITLDTRFFERMPDTNIAASYNGILMSAKFNSNKFVYSDTKDLSKMGFHNAFYQTNNFLDKGIKSIIIVNDTFVISTSDTHTVNTRQATPGGSTDYGENYLILPNPLLTVRGIGTTHQSKWGEGFSEEQILITNEPAVRPFNGESFGEDLSRGTIKRTYLRGMDSLVLVGVDKNSGFFIWGKTK